MRNGTGSGRGLPLARNLSAVRRRLARRRDPDGPTGARARRRLVAGAAAIAALAIVAFLLVADARSVPWALGLPPAVRDAFALVSRLAESPRLLVASGAFVAVLLLGDWASPPRRIAAAWIELGALAAFFFLAVAGSGIATNLVKWTLGRSRPVRFGDDGILTLSPVSFGFEHVSFPSGHTTTATAAAMALAFVFRGRPPVLVLAVGFVVAVALSRVVVGAHFPSDVVAGAFVGSTVSYLLAHALGRRGIAFQRQPDGSLAPRTIAIRGVFGRAGGWRAALRGLAAAWFGGACGQSPGRI